MLSEGDLWRGYGVSLPGQDRKYHVKQHRNRWTVMVWYRPVDELAFAWLPTDVQCPQLVAAVNRVALQHRGRRGGSFYINEYNQVLKPIWADASVELRYIGEFPRCRFRFELFDGTWVSRLPHSPNRQLSPGSDWIGPRCGIPYWLERRGRGGLRIYRPRLLQSEDDFVQFRHREYLDAYTRSYERLAQAVWVAKGGLGGRFYVTEAGTVWTPYRSGPAPMDWNYRYVGCLWDHVNEWYPKWCG